MTIYSVFTCTQVTAFHPKAVTGVIFPFEVRNKNKSFRKALHLGLKILG